MPGDVELVGLDSGLVWGRWWIQSGSIAKSWVFALRNWTDGVAIHCGSMGKVKDWEKKKNQELCFTYHSVLFPDGSNCKESACNEGDPWVGKIPWRRQWQPTLVFLPGESHGQRRLTGYRSWGHKESDTTEWLTDSVLLCYKRSMLKDNNWQSKSENQKKTSEGKDRCSVTTHLVIWFPYSSLINQHGAA